MATGVEEQVQHSYILTCCNLAMLCGNVGVYGGGVNPLRGQNNVQGACDMGGLPNVFSGYQPVADEKIRTVFSTAWGRELPDRSGLTITNTERRCMRIRKAIEPIANTLPDWEIICRLSTAMGYEMHYESPEAIFNEMTALTPKGYGGMNYERFGIDGLQWPCQNPDHPGTPYLHKDRFTRGRGKFHAVDYRDPAKMPDEEYPYFLTTGRMFAHFHTGTMTRVSPHLDVEQATGYVNIHPKDAAALAVKEDDVLILSSRRGQMEAPAKLTHSVQPGTLFLPIHFGENPTNVLTNAEAFDPLAKIPEFKVSAVNVKKLEAY